LLARAHVLVNPSVKEGWGLVNIEANAMGTPVVAYNSAGLVDSVKNNESGLITTKNAPEELARLIRMILYNKEKYQRLQSGAVAWSKNFSWEKSRKMSLALIQKI
jgi:glycosyltransferase involved in cell wall biosynthesis